MKRTVITLVVGIAIGAAIVAVPALGSHHAAKRYLTMRPGDYLTVPGMDLSCVDFRRDPDGHVTGNLLSCFRESEAGKSWSMNASPRWILVYDAQGYRRFAHARLP
jgi:hypothetical protein